MDSNRKHTEKIDRQKHPVSRLPIRLLLENGNILLEVAPGLATTMSSMTHLNAIRVKAQRGQFTPDFLLTKSIVAPKEPTNNNLVEPLT